jgi:hypothetical protein
MDTHAMLAAAGRFARSRLVLLEVAIEPDLLPRDNAVAYCAYLHHLVFAAINRAESAVLITASRHADGIEIAVLDDGTGAAQYDSTVIDAAPHGSTVAVTRNPACGTTIRLRLAPPVPQPAPAELVLEAAW